MLLHSVTPIEFLKYPTDMPITKTISINNGYIEGYQTDDGLRISRVISTDLSLYLDKNLSINSIYPSQTQSGLNAYDV